MKPKSFRHLTARSRKRVLRRLCREWQDLANDVKYYESELAIGVDPHEQSLLLVLHAFASRKLAQLEHLLA